MVGRSRACGRLATWAAYRVSDTPRVVLAVEGPTDTIVLRAILLTVLKDFVLDVAQPEPTLGAGSNYGPDGGGWKGVRGWCQGVAQSGGTASSPVFQNADIVIVHLDADVSDDPEITCRQPKSVGSRPYEPTTDSLRSLVAQWLGGAHQKLVVCIPHLETETWLLPIFRTAVTSPEDHSNPLQEFASGTPKLCDANYKKQRSRYEGVSELITQGWALALVACPEAFFFDAELRSAVAT
jgi:hypothetical protein